MSVASLPGWAADDHAAALDTFRLTAERHLERPFRSRPVSPLSGFDDVASASLSATDARAFFETWFEPRTLGSGKLTGYYEPVVQASAERTSEFSIPLHARPPELVATEPPMRYGVRVGGVVRPYHDRGAIQAGALDGRGLEIAWLRGAVDAFIIHVQGSARLAMRDGTVRRVSYAAKSGHDYSSLGAVMLARLRERAPDTPATAVTADKLSAWLRGLGDELPAVLALNRSYIFFAIAPAGDEGPVAAAKVPLTAGRSLAVDRNLHSFGLPFWIETDGPLPDEAAPTRRLMVAQDTGSAILGEARGDLFVGSGDEAGRIAGAVNHPTRFTVLMPRRP